MIQASDVLGSRYDDIKNLVVRTDFDSETLKSFSTAGIEPPVGEAKFTEDLYFFGCKIDRYKVTFKDNRIDEIVFITGKDGALEMINDLLASKRFEFNFITKKQIEDTPFEVLTGDSEEGINFTEFKIQRFKSNPSSQFNRDDIDEFACLTFRSDNRTVIVQQEYTENESFFVFELRMVINKNK